jgi:serine/threonine-protein phosphatase 4 regulatory subunit 1
MLLSHNPQVANPTRDGIIQLVARLRGHGEVTVETWGSTTEPTQERQIYLSQTGPHSHDIVTFDHDERTLVEQELLFGIVLGMGSLSTDVPDSLFNEDVEILGEDGEVIDQMYKAELYRLQMVHEATLGRALSLSFIGSLSELYSPQEVVEFGFVDEVIRGQDGDVATRAEAALVMGNVARAAPLEEIERLLEAFVNFANDENHQVRQSACTVLPALCKRIVSDDERREFAVTAMEGFMNHGNEDVQCAALEALGEVIYSFANDPLGPPYQLLEIYCNDKDTSTGDDSDWDILASFNFPGVCLTLGADRWPELRGLYNRLVTRAGERVLRTVAASLHELANILHSEQVAEDILPVYHRCLECGDDIRERIFEHIDVLIARLPQALGWSCFKQLAEMWRSDTLGGWRAREQLALHIPSFLETFNQHSEVEAVLDFMNGALLDRFAAVRDAATYAVPRSYEILADTKCSQDVLHNMLLRLGSSRSYRERLT